MNTIPTCSNCQQPAVALGYLHESGDGFLCAACLEMAIRDGEVKYSKSLPCLSPTYYVEHPDGSYSKAQPQPRQILPQFP